MIFRFLISFLLIFCSFTFSSSAKTVEEVVSSAAILAFISGKVELENNQKWEQLSLRAIIKPGQKIRTREKSRAEVVFSNGTKIRLNENTELKMQMAQEKRKTSIFDLLKGNIWLNIIKEDRRFAVRGNLATLAVIGTVFNVSASSDRMEVVVAEGSVGVAPATENLVDLDKNLADLGYKFSAEETNQNIEKPVTIKRPFEEIEKPVKKINGPRQITRESWIMLVERQKIVIEADGTGIVSDATEKDFAEEWLFWNLERDKFK